MKRSCLYLACILTVMSLVFSGCTSQPKKEQVVEVSADYLHIIDDDGRTVILTKKPQRIAVLSTSFLDALYGVGGEAVARPSSKTTAIYPASQMAGEVGFVYNINSEQLVSLQPDLVIGFQGIHEKLIPILDSSHIPVIMLKMKTYDDVLMKVKLLGGIVGSQVTAQRMIDKMQNKINEVVARLPAQSKKIVILHATAKNVTVELDNSIAGNVAKMLRIKNIATNSQPLDSDPDIAPYSLEKLVEGDADAILVVTMGNMADIETTMKTDLASNPAWAGLRAVQNNQVFFLPSELFQLNPGIRFHEAVEYMAKVVYPEVYGNAN